MPNNPDITPDPTAFDLELWQIADVFETFREGYGGYDDDYMVHILNNINDIEQAVVQDNGNTLSIPASEWDSPAGAYAASFIGRIKQIVSQHAEQRRADVTHAQGLLSELPMWGG